MWRLPAAVEVRMTKSFYAAFLSLFLMFVPVSANADPVSDEWQG